MVFRLPRIRGITLIAGLLITLLFSCGSLTDLVLDDPAFLEDMVRATLSGEKFKITPEDHPGIRKLLNDDNPDYRLAGVILAGQAGAPNLYPDIVNAVFDDDAAVSEAALDVVLGSPQDFRRYLLEELDVEDSTRRADALMVLSEIGGEDLVPIFIRYFDDSDPEMRNRASLAVRQVTDRGNPFLQDALSSENSLVAATAYRTLGRYRDPDDAPFFIEAFTSTNAEIRKEAQLAALRLGEAGLPFLHIEALDPERPLESRLAALNVIQGLRSPESISTLMLLLGDGEDGISTKVSGILGTYGAEAIPVLTRIYNESGQEYRINVVRLMGEIRAPEALTTLASALGDESIDVRYTAFLSMQQFGTEAWPTLRAVITDADSADARILAMRILRMGIDSWLLRRGDGGVNEAALFLLIVDSEDDEIAAYLESIEADTLSTESILGLKNAWTIAEEFSEIEADIASGDDPYLYLWRQREIFAAESRELLRRSFDVMHEYFETRDSAILDEARELRAESRLLEIEAQAQKDRLEEMSEEQQRRGQSLLVRYRELRDELVRTWEFIDPELRNLALIVYGEGGMDPEALSRQSALLD